MTPMHPCRHAGERKGSCTRLLSWTHSCGTHGASPTAIRIILSQTLISGCMQACGRREGAAGGDRAVHAAAAHHGGHPRPAQCPERPGAALHRGRPHDAQGIRCAPLGLNCRSSTCTWSRCCWRPDGSSVVCVVQLILHLRPSGQPEV